MTDTIFEFRDYTLRPGQRDTLIELFERAFVECQDTLGAHVRATFRDLDRPDHFVWIRSFADAQSRAAALTSFYSGPVWAAHRDAARATMIDTDNARQLSAVSGALPALSRPAVGATMLPETLVVAKIYYPRSESTFAEHFGREVARHLADLGAEPFATFATDHAPNAFPPLPIREEAAFITLTRFASPAAYTAQSEELTRLDHKLEPFVSAQTEVHRLQPTARSALR